MSQAHQHDRVVGGSHAVTPLELFFDLVFVFALTQVTSLLAHDLSWIGVLRGCAVLAAIWWAWAGYAWLTNSVDIDEDIPSRLLMLVAMAAFLVVGLSAPNAFGQYAVLFACAYLVVRLLHVGLYIMTTRTDPDVLGAVIRLSPGMIIAPTLILIGAFAPEGLWRAGLWALALLVDYATPIVAGTGGWRIDAGHFAERHGLVIIIALGESVVALGVAAAGEELTPAIVTAAVLGVVTIAGMWWLYFDVVAVAAARVLRQLQGQSQVAAARDSFSYIHLFMVLGIVFVALGLKEILIDAQEPFPAVGSVALLAGLAIYLFAHIAFRLRNMRTLNRQRLVVACVFALMIPVSYQLSSLLVLAIATGVIVALVAYESIRFREARHELRAHEPLE